MDLRQLRYFVTIVDCGSLSRASERLHIAQPSLSQHVVGMESDLGTPLLLRNPQGVVPTEAGKTLYRQASQLLRQFENLCHEVRGAGSGEVGKVTVGLPTSVAAVLAMPLYLSLKQRHPGVQVNFIERTNDNLADLLANGRLDMAVLFCDLESRGMAIRPLLLDSLSVYGNPSTLTSWEIGETTTARQLSERPIVLPGPETNLRTLVQRIFTRSESKLSVSADIDSFLIRLSLAASEGVCTILSSGLRTFGAAHGLDEVPIIEAIGSRTVSLCWLTTTPASAAAESTRELIVATCQTLVSERIWVGAQLVG